MLNDVNHIHVLDCQILAGTGGLHQIAVIPTCYIIYSQCKDPNIKRKLIHAIITTWCISQNTIMQILVMFGIKYFYLKQPNIYIYTVFTRSSFITETYLYSQQSLFNKIKIMQSKPSAQICQICPYKVSHFLIFSTILQ